MENRKAATIVGITVFAAIAIILGSIFYLRGYFAARDKVIYYADFTNVGRLAEGDNITVAGVTVGRVQRIILTGGVARVEFFVSRTVTVGAGTVAAIDATDVFGSAKIDLLLGRGAPLPSKSHIEGQLGPGIEDIMRRSAVIIDQTINLLSKAEKLITRFTELAAADGAAARSLENIETISANAREFSGHLEEYDRLLRRTLASIDSTSASADSLIAGNSEGVRLTLAHLASVSGRMDSLLVRLENGRGTAGRLLNDESLYEDLQATLLEARNLIAEVRDNPDKFVKVKLF